MFGRNDLTVYRAIESKILQIALISSSREHIENYNLQDLTTRNQLKIHIIGVRTNCTAKLEFWKV